MGSTVCVGSMFDNPFIIVDEEAAEVEDFVEFFLFEVFKVADERVGGATA